MLRYGAILLFYATLWHDEFDRFFSLSGCSRMRRPRSVLLMHQEIERFTAYQWHSSHRASALLSCDYFFDASHKLCHVWTLLDALTLLQVFKCGLESGLRDCGASQTY